MAGGQSWNTPRRGKAARVFTEFNYQTHKSWARARRVVAKAEYLDKGDNPRFVVVTSLSPTEWEARALYEQLTNMLLRQCLKQQERPSRVRQ